MMRCKKSMGLRISKFIDDEITPYERGQVDDHLRECDTCRNFLEILRRNEMVVAEALIESRRVASIA